MKASERLAFLPDVKNLRKLTQSLAMLDAILSPEWEYRYFSFDSHWDKDEMMASMRDGSGNDYCILFNSFGAIVKGFDHESIMSPYAREPKQVWSGVLENVPTEFKDFLSEPAFSIEETTFCIWKKLTDESWQIGEIEYPDEDYPDGLEGLLFGLDGNPQTYKTFAEEYYEIEVSMKLVEHIYQHKPLTDKLVKSLNKGVSINELQKDIKDVNYPLK